MRRRPPELSEQGERGGEKLIAQSRISKAVALGGRVQRRGRIPERDILSLRARGSFPPLQHVSWWSRRRIVLPGRDPWELPTTSRAGLEGLGFEIIERPEPSFLFDGSVLITGEVARTTDFERGFAIHQALRSGKWEPDPLILDDQALIVHIDGRGLLVITGCGHAGVVNIVRYARAPTGVDHVHAIVGGFHLTGAMFEPIIAPTVEALGALAPDLVLPAHCTGWRAMHELANRLPDAFIANSVGTRLELAAA